MSAQATQKLLRIVDERKTIEDYQSDAEPRWCTGCGDLAILTSVQRLCRDEQLVPERTVFVSGIGCSSRLPHYVKTYGFHGIHGRALPIAEGIKIRRPDLNVFVITGDGDCTSIGAGHWIHAVRYNMDMTMLLHDNQIFGLTKKQVSPTSPRGLQSNTTPRGAYIEPINPLSTVLGVTNVSFVAQAVDWIPDMMYTIISKAFHHKGLSFVRIIQRCPEFLPDLLDPFVHDPDKTLLLEHEKGVMPDAGLKGTYKQSEVHDPLDINRAREIASMEDQFPVGILYHDPQVPCYEDVRHPDILCTPDQVKSGLESELDKFTIWPEG
ncbi:MAG: thiamine pyrophosphate-dependent enzyme [Rhodospirillales bacterium]|nr:thiamine pyrophosphate-dependent enzyme [Rhodospirillales bacterium]